MSSNPYLTFSSPNSFTIGVLYNTKNWNGTIEYSNDSIVWNIWDGTAPLDSFYDNIKYVLYLRGLNNNRITGYYYRWIIRGTNISCIGNIENLLDYQMVSNGQHPTMFQYCFCELFYECSGLISAPELPATTLSDYCYKGMFYNCTSLTTAPALPATTLGTWCYSSMFRGCKNLIYGPTILPALTLKTRCYNEMFYLCENLEIAPILPATTLVDYCYNYMFNGCTSLTTPPNLPATTLANYCYQSMFSGCTALKVLPQLPATTLFNNCYRSLFSRCTNIKLSTQKTGNYQTEYRIPSNGTGIIGTDSLLNMFSNTGGTFTGTPTINTTYYLWTDIIRKKILKINNKTVGKFNNKNLNTFNNTNMMSGLNMWENPELINGNLTLNQAYSITQNNTILEVE